MSRPATCSAVYGFKPATGSVTLFMKDKGTISTSPPTATVRITRTMSSAWLRSMRSWVSFMAASGVGGGELRHRNQRLNGLARCDRPEYVVGHDQHSREI